MMVFTYNVSVSSTTTSNPRPLIQSLTQINPCKIVSQMKFKKALCEHKWHPKKMSWCGRGKNKENNIQI